MDDIIVASPDQVDPEVELARLVDLYKSAGGVGVQLLNMVGGQAENLLDRLPQPVQDGLQGATERALGLAMRAAQDTRGAVPDQAAWVNTAVATAMGAAGGIGGLPAALIELPATTTLLLRSIQGVAAQNGFDPNSKNVQFDCIRVFAAAGPLAKDDGADLGFFSARLTLTGGAMQKLIASVAPKLATVLGQKLATQTVPVLGAIAGATTNYVYTSYYQQIAQVHFGLRKLAIDADLPHEDLVTQLRIKMQPVPA